MLYLDLYGSVQFGKRLLFLKPVNRKHEFLVELSLYFCWNKLIFTHPSEFLQQIYGSWETFYISSVLQLDL